MLSKISLYSALLLSIFVFTPSKANAATTTKSACVTATGKIVVRSRCRASETKLSPQTLNQSIATSPLIKGPTGDKGASGLNGAPGVKGPKGRIDFSACYKVGASTSNLLRPDLVSSLDITMFCNSPTFEFIKDYEFSITRFPGSESTKVFVQAKSVEFLTVSGDTRTYQAYITATRHTPAASGAFTLNGSILCCPR